MSILRRYNGEEWVAVAGPTDPARYKQGTLASRPAPIIDDVGMFFWATDELLMYYCDGATWQEVISDDSITVAKLNGTVAGAAGDFVALDGAGGFQGVDSGAYATQDDIDERAIVFAIALGG